MREEQEKVQTDGSAKKKREAERKVDQARRNRKEKNKKRPSG